MKKYSIALEDLSKSRWFVLIGSALTLFSVFMPWHTVGTAALNTVLSFNGFQDQNMIIGVITFVFSFAALCIIGLPLLGVNLPRSGWKESGMLIFFGGESSLLLLVLTIMHATSITRAANYDLRLGIHLALIGAALVFIGGQLIKNEEQQSIGSRAEPLAHLPRRPSVNHLDLRNNDPVEKEKEDARMKLDI
jgi:hypothetical protein